MKKRDQIRIALEKLATKNRARKLMPERVVDEARDPTSPLHDSFTWDDTKAAHAHRLWQARQLIADVWEVVDERVGKTPSFVSLQSDRKDGGYRMMPDVLSSADLRKQMLSTALAELNAIQFRYERLTELAKVFRATKEVEKKYKK